MVEEIAMVEEKTDACETLVGLSTYIPTHALKLLLLPPLRTKTLQTLHKGLHKKTLLHDATPKPNDDEDDDDEAPEDPMNTITIKIKKKETTKANTASKKTTDDTKATAETDAETNAADADDHEDPDDDIGPQPIDEKK
jgi:hypothetical protein